MWMLYEGNYYELRKLAGRLAQYLKNWEQLTEDRWVLQAVSGYQLELFQMPWQTKPMPEIKCSTEEQMKISEEIKDLLSKGAVRETILSPKSCVKNIAIWILSKYRDISLKQ